MTGKLWGYARVSSTDQDLTIQVERLKAFGVPEALIFSEKMTGTNAERPELRRVLAILGKGDTLVCTRLDRLARSQRDFLNISHDLAERGAGIVLADQPFETTSPMGRAFLGILAIFAELETGVRRERQREGVARAKTNGKYTGGKARVDRAEVLRLRSVENMGASAIGRLIGCHRATVNRILGAAA